MSLEEQNKTTPEVETEIVELSKKLAPISYKTGGLASADTPIPENQNDDPRYITSIEYFNKYSYAFPVYLNERFMAPACREWHKDEKLPEDQRIGLISEKRLVADTGCRAKNGKIMQYKNRKRWQWFIFDIPPQDHPGWNAYQARLINSLRKDGIHVASKFKELAPIYLANFDNARKDMDHTQFKIYELAGMMHVSPRIIRSWTTVGVEGYGKLPHIKASDTIKPLRTEDGTYSCHAETVKAGRVDYYFATKDIRRFLKGELADPNNKFNTIDDATQHTNANEVAAASGYFVWERNKAKPLTFEGFMEWCKENIVMYDRRTRRIMPFKPCPKQIEFYKKVFALNRDGMLKHTFIFTSRPRGDYKTFDIALIALFRFFNLEYEKIYLVTNSVQQTTHLVYRETVDIIKKSPTLSAILSMPALDIQKDGIYLRAGRGVENIFSSMEIVSAEGGARSNATCIIWSEAWKFRGNESDVAEIMQSVRGIDNAMFLAESTVAPKGHWFQRFYAISLTGEDPVLFFQYYDDTQRQNPKITEAFLNSVKRAMPLHWKMFFGNRWEDAATGLFSEARIIEMGYLGINGGISRNSEMLGVIDSIAEINAEIKKYQGGIDVSKLMQQRNELFKLLTPLNYSCPATPETLRQFSELYDCDFIIGIGLDRAKQLQDRSDRTVLSTVARAVFNEQKAETWGTDRMFFLLDLIVSTELSYEGIMQDIQHSIDIYGGGFGYIDLEDYNVVDIYKSCEKLYGKDVVVIAPNSMKHQVQIFTEMCLASRGGYLKIPSINIYTDEEDKVHFDKPPIGKQDILRTEMAVFENSPPISMKGRGSDGYFGSPFKKKTGHTRLGDPKDDCVYSIAHAIQASIRGDIPAVMRNMVFASAIINDDVVGDYR